MVKLYLKIYFKKLISFVLGFLIWIIVFRIGFDGIVTFANFFSAYPVVRTLIVGGIPTLIMLVIIYSRRKSNNTLKREYYERIDSIVGFKGLILYLIKTRDFIAEVATFSSVLLPFLFAIGSNNKDAPVLINIFTGLIVFAVFVLGFSLIDFLLWFLVHKSWKKIRHVQQTYN